MKKVAERCKHNFEAGDRNRGRSYFYDEMVRVQAVDEDHFYALVAGSYDQDYDVTLNWSETADNSELAAYCSCPRFSEGWACKHLWAALLELDAQEYSLSVPGRGKLILEWDEPLEVAFEAAQTQQSTVTRKKVKKKKAKSRRSRPTQKPAWHKTFEVLQQTTLRPDGTWEDALSDALVAKQREVWYVLSVGKSLTYGALIIDFFERQTKKNGQFGKPKQLRLDGQEIDSFTNADDRELLSQLVQFAHVVEYNSSYRYRSYGNERVEAAEIPPSLIDYLMPRLAATGRLVWVLDSSQPFEDAQPLSWDGEVPWQFEMKVTPEAKKKHWAVEGFFSRDGQTCPLHNAVLATPSGLLLMDDTLFRLDVDRDVYGWLHAINVNSPVEVPFKDRSVFLEKLWSTPTLPKIDLPDDLRWEQRHEPPQPKLKIYAPNQASRQQRQKCLVADVSFQYGSNEVRMDSPSGNLPVEQEASPEKSNGKKKKVVSKKNGKPGAVYVRDREAERNQIADLASLGANASGKYYDSKGDIEFPQKQLATLVDQLLEKGWQVEAEGKLYRTAGDFNISVQSDIDWFELDASFDFDGVEVKLPELLAAVRKGEKFVELGDGTRGILPDQWLAKYQHLADLGTVEEGKLRFKPSQALLLDAMLDEQDNLQVDRKFSQFRKRLREFDGIQAKQEPKTFVETINATAWAGFTSSDSLGSAVVWPTTWVSAKQSKSFRCSKTDAHEGSKKTKSDVRRWSLRPRVLFLTGSMKPQSSHPSCVWPTTQASIARSVSAIWTTIIWWSPPTAPCGVISWS